MKTLYSPESEKLGQWLREQREAKGLSMRQAGGLIDKPHSFIAKTEIGQRRLDVIEYIWYCRKLDIDAITGLNYLMEDLSNNSLVLEELHSDDM
nr:helix-turn-helix transcriptional regulator [uncultured Methylophaga sp.]